MTWEIGHLLQNINDNDKNLIILLTIKGLSSIQIDS